MDLFGRRISPGNSARESDPAFEQKRLQREIENRQTFLAEGAVAIHRQIEPVHPELKLEARKMLLRAFDYVKYEVLPTLDVMQPEIVPTLPASVNFLRRKITERLTDIVTSLEQFKNIERVYPDFFELFSFEEQYAMRAKVEARSQK